MIDEGVQHHLRALISKCAWRKIKALIETRLGELVRSDLERDIKRGQSSPHLTRLPKHIPGASGSKFTMGWVAKGEEG